MLVLKRNYGEAVKITTPQGETILIVVSEVEANGVKLAFEAPASVRIDRIEVAAAREQGPNSPSAEQARTAAWDSLRRKWCS